MKLGVVGTGMIAQIVVPHLTEWGCGIGAVCGTPDTENQVRELTERYGGTPYTIYDEMLDDPEIDTVYIAVPNSMHYAFTIKALEHGKHVIVEKPLASNDREAREIAAMARERNLLVYEAISTLHLPNYKAIRAALPRLGEIKLVQSNYCKWSSRYAAFKAGETPAAFDPKRSGGALMDLGLYNFHYIMGLFGTPETVTYFADVERGIDTAGVAVLDYGTFKAISTAAKDSPSPARCTIQGTGGYILQTMPPNNCGQVTLHLADGTEEAIDLNPELQWESEFRDFAAGIDANDQAGCHELLDHSIAVAKAMTEARLGASVVFPADHE